MLRIGEINKNEIKIKSYVSIRFCYVPNLARKCKGEVYLQVDYVFDSENVLVFTDVCAKVIIVVSLL